MAIPIRIIAAAMTATRNDDGKQQAINNPIPKDTRITPKPQFLRLLILSPHKVTVIFIIFTCIINVKKAD